MTFPAGLTLVTVAGQFDNFPNGGASGWVEFVARYPLVGSADNSIVPPFVAHAALDASGEFTVDLPATNDPGWTPQGWAYAVRVNAGGMSFRGTLQLDYLTTSVQLSDLLQVDGTAESGVTYIALSQRSIAGGVAALDTDGDVTDATGAKITGGGGGGASPSSTVVSETSYGQSASAGNATAYSRGNHTHGTPAAPASTDISDATTTGKAVLTAASQAAARTAIGAETSGAAASALVTAEAYTDSAVAGLSGTYQPLDADLTTIAGLTATTGHFLVAQSSAWASVSAATAKTALSLAAADVGLGSVTNDAQVKLSTVTTKGDLVAATGSAAVARVAAGSNGQVLTADSTQTAGLKWISSAPVLVLGPVDAIPGGTATGTVIVRTAS